jgi:hypothetical protein
MENKITKEQLDKITDQQKALNMMLANIGVLESQNTHYYIRLLRLIKKLKRLKLNLKKNMEL